jgi:signal transduction histidine kinase
MSTLVLHTLLEEDKTSALMASFGQLVPGWPRMWLVDAAGRLVGYHPNAAQDTEIEDLLLALERVQQFRKTTLVPMGTATPIWVRGELAGALIVAAPDSAASNGVAVLQLLARVLSLLAENKLIQEDLLGEALDRYRELNLLYRAGEMMAASLDLAQVNQVILDESRRLVEAREGAVMLRDPDGQLTLWASYGLEGVEEKAGIPPGHELAKNVVRSGQTEVLQRPIPGSRKKPLSAVLCVPLKIKDEVLGVISLAHTDPERTFPANDVSLINALAAQAAVAIENARMFGDLSALHNELEAANSRLRELDQLKSSFLGVITHELRSPFANIDFSMQLIERDGTKRWKRAQQEQWAQLVTGIKEAKRMIDNLVSFAELLSKQGELHLSEVDFPLLLKEIIETLTQVTRARQIELFVNGSGTVPPIRADKQRLADAIYHLVHNAIKFNRPGGTVRVGYWSDGKKVQFEVQDTGQGIGAEQLKQLWDPFSQAADPLRRGREGLGLGLALVRYVVRAHGGRVGASSQAGAGSTFRFWLPIAGPAGSTGQIERTQKS